VTVGKHWDSEDGLISDVKPPSKIKNDAKKATYEPFADDDVEFDVTKWPDPKPAPTTVRKWDDKTSAPTGMVRDDTATEDEEKR
jgi:hypothetical protein